MDSFAEFQIPNWDGEGALPLSDESINYALQAAADLRGLPPPALVPEPTGELALVWRKGRNSLIVAFDHTGKGAYSAVVSKGKVYGDLQADEDGVFGGDIMRQIIINLINMVEESDEPQKTAR